MRSWGSESVIKSSLEIVRHHRRHDLNPAKALSAGGKEDQKEGSLTLSSDPTDQTRSIEQRRCLIQELLHVECDFEALLMKPRTRAGIGRTAYSRGLIEPVADFIQIRLNCCFSQLRVHRR